MKTSVSKLLLFRIILRTIGILLILASSSTGISWMMFLGVVVFGFSFFISTSRQIGSNPNARQFIVYSALLTIGVILMFIGISWLTFTGLTIALLSSFFSSQWPASSRILFPLLISFGWAVLQFVLSMRDGDIFRGRSPPLWYWALLTGVWFWGIASEYRRWRKSINQ